MNDNKADDKKIAKKKSKFQKAKKGIQISGPGIKFSLKKGDEVDVSTLPSSIKESLINNGIINKE